MPASHAWRGTSRRLIVSFVLVLLVPAAAVVWLGARLVEQDRALASRQLRERRESAADRTVAGLEQAVAALERQLAAGTAGTLIQPNDDAVVMTLAGDVVEAVPAKGLLYLPALPPSPAEPADAFEAGETLEFRANDLRGAAAAFRALAGGANAAVRAGALLRLARTERKLNHVDEALRAYGDLERIADARLSGLPADLVARRARCVLLDQMERTAELVREAKSLHTDLLAARWRIDRGTFTAYADEAGRWAGAAAPRSPDREALSAAAEWIWQQWTDATRQEFRSPGRRALRFGTVSVSLLWQPTGDRLAVLLAGPRFQQREWFDTLPSALNARGVQVALADDDGQAVAGTLPREDTSTERRASSVTRLPWTVVVGTADTAADLEEIAGRRRLLLAGLALLVGLVVAGGYFIVRAVSREFTVAQLQSDFVAAVSHEFRTPLTSLQQFTDLLNDNPDLPAAKRRTFYQAQARATERLRRLVESLLDFGRMEAGARPYRLERRTAAPLIRDIVDEFRRDATPEGFTIDAAIDTGEAEIDVDADAFARALRNLLENAVKYSGASRVVSVQASAAADGMTVRVRDAGLGIPRHEHEQIFKKFVRGTSSRTHGIKGTGIGLAMVRHIVDAHGGTVSVESAPGRGSTFTIAIPRLQNGRNAGWQESADEFSSLKTNPTSH